MKTTNKLAAICAAISRKIARLTIASVPRRASDAMMWGGVFVLSIGLADLSAAQLGDPGRDTIGEAANVILSQLIEGSFGALIMIVSGLVAIVSAAMGAYKAAMSCLIIAVGAFILRTFVEIFFGPDVIPNS